MLLESNRRVRKGGEYPGNFKEAGDRTPKLGSGLKRHREGGWILYPEKTLPGGGNTKNWAVETLARRIHTRGRRLERLVKKGEGTEMKNFVGTEERARSRNKKKRGVFLERERKKE